MASNSFGLSWNQRFCAPISCFLLNIFNIRSVIRKPPTTLVEEQVTATNPRAVLNRL